QMRGPLKVPIIGLLTPLEERACTAYGRATDAIWLIGVLAVLGAVGAFVLYRYRAVPINPWPLATPFLLCLVFLLLIALVVFAALWRLNRRSLAVYCQQIVTQAQRYLSVVDGESRREGLALYQRVVDLADQIGTERLRREGLPEALNPIGDA